jgi:hypothetical protein
VAPTSTTAKACAFRLAVCGQTGAIEILKAIAGNAIEAALAAAERIRTNSSTGKFLSLELDQARYQAEVGCAPI